MSRPTFHWFSPLPPARTAIADWAAQLLPALTARARVVLWTDQATWDPGIERLAEVRRYRPDQAPWSALNAAGTAIYHLGNSPFHTAILDMARSHPGLVVLHDIRLHDLAIAWFRSHHHDPVSYLAYMGRHYGSAGRRDGERFQIGGQLDANVMSVAYPMTELALDGALGAFVHTPAAFADLRERECWTVGYAPLPYPARELARPPRCPRSSPPYQLIVFGHLGRNRRLGTIVRAFAEFPERHHFRLQIYGSIPELEHLRASIHDYALGDLVTIHGSVPDADLDAALAVADLALNLRFPTMGEASYSQLRIWEHALPSLVTRVDWYAGLSDEAVAFVRPEHEQEDIQAQLRSFLADPARFAAMGLAGRRLLEECHDPARYVEALLAFATGVERTRLGSTANRLAERAGAELADWFRGEVPDETARAVASRIAALLR